MDQDGYVRSRLPFDEFDELKNTFTSMRNDCQTAAHFPSLCTCVVDSKDSRNFLSQNDKQYLQNHGITCETSQISRVIVSSCVRYYICILRFSF